MAIVKNEIDSDLLLKIIDDINSKTKTLTSYEEDLGINRSSIKRRIKGAGYTFNKEEGKWLITDATLSNKGNTPKAEPVRVADVIVKVKEEVAPKKKEKIVGQVGRPKKEGEYKRFNMELPADLLKALKRKALEEDTTATEIIIKYLVANIEDKYR
ncbi:hypothetical protein [Clostridium botulinum]|uniref:hypothetical protein n=1 Tax=Clostridium botulinum TaxID=1491 RepID=UPI0007732F8A|nr:hypothetical protein [Clostridium botulinum]NFN46902.1 hypothetical protein [Clostridium botulinum]